MEEGNQINIQSCISNGQENSGDIDLLPIQIELRQSFEKASLNEIVAELLLKPTVFGSENNFSDSDGDN